MERFVIIITKRSILLFHKALLLDVTAVLDPSVLTDPEIQHGICIENVGKNIVLD